MIRHVTVPPRFGSPGEYCRVWRAAVTEEINLFLAELAQRFHAQLPRLQGIASPATRQEAMRAVSVRSVDLYIGT
jgi:hypothetical protein